MHAINDVLLTRLARCQRRAKDLSTRLAQVEQSRDRWRARATLKEDRRVRFEKLTRSRDAWKRKATERRRELERLRPRKRPATLEYGPDVVAQILSIPARDIR